MLSARLHDQNWLEHSPVTRLYVISIYYMFYLQLSLDFKDFMITGLHCEVL